METLPKAKIRGVSKIRGQTSIVSPQPKNGETRISV